MKIQFVIALFLFVFFFNRMPAYDNNPWSSLFFVIFIIVCMYIFVSIFLAVVYKNYRKHLKVDYRYVFLNIVYFAVMGGISFFPSTRLLLQSFLLLRLDCRMPSTIDFLKVLRFLFPVPVVFPHKT